MFWCWLRSKVAANGFENRFGKVGTVATGGRGLDIIIHMEDETTTDANYSPLLWPLVNGQEGVVVTQAYLCRHQGGGEDWSSQALLCHPIRAKHPCLKIDVSRKGSGQLGSWDKPGQSSIILTSPLCDINLIHTWSIYIPLPYNSIY